MANWLGRRFAKRRGHVAQWIDVKQTQDKTAAPIAERFLAMFVVRLMRYRSDEPSRESTPEWCKPFEIKHPYSDDRGLFELACYLFHECDLYMFHKHQDLRNSISDELIERLMVLFGPAMRGVDVTALFNEREVGYSELAKQASQDPMRSKEHYLTALMCIAESGRGAPAGAFRQTPLELARFEAGRFMTTLIAVNAWACSAVPSFSATTDLYADGIRRLLEEARQHNQGQ